MDEETLREWEKYTLDKADAPDLNNIKSFLKNRADFLETVNSKSAEKQTKRREFPKISKGFVATSYSCNYCKEAYNIYTCEEFLKLPVGERSKHVENSRLCVNCLRTGHSAKRCRAGRCKKCRARHNSLVHVDREVATDTQASVLNSRIPHNSSGYVFLSTACVHLLDRNNKAHCERALPDCGSQTSFLSERMLQRLKLPLAEANLSIHGISESSSTSRYKCSVKLQSLHTPFATNLTCYILPEITGITPSCKINVAQLALPNHIRLADPEYFEPGFIDLLIGADFFLDIAVPRKSFLWKK